MRVTIQGKRILEGVECKIICRRELNEECYER